MKRLMVMLLLTALSGCPGDPGESDGNNGASNNGTTNNGVATNGNSADAGSTDGDATPDVGEDLSDDAGTDATADVDLGPVGGVRPADVVVPTDWTAQGSYPVVVLLHGYSATSRVQNLYFRTSALVDELQYVLVLPDGLKDSSGKQYWNATDWCCDFGDVGPDDSRYLSELADEVVQRFAGDPRRVYFMGHSNGGFMSYRMACDHADQVAAVASLAGSGFWTAESCQPTEPVAVLQMHGTFDATIKYEGAINTYPGVDDLIDRWLDRNGCDDMVVDGGRVNYDSAVVGDETAVVRHPSCDAATTVELWRMEGSGHIPGLSDQLARDALAFLFAHAKPE